MSFNVKTISFTTRQESKKRSCSCNSLKEETDKTGQPDPMAAHMGERGPLRIVQTILVARTVPGCKEIHKGVCRVPESCTYQRE